MAPVTSAQNYFAILCWNLTYAPQLAASYDARDPSQQPCALGGTPLAVPVYPAAVGYDRGPGVVAAGNENRTTEADRRATRDKHALLYIVVVLLFYSSGIVVAIVMYLKREKAEIEEEKAYDDYASFRADPDRWARYFRVQRMVAQLDRVEKEAAEKHRLLLQQQQSAAGCSSSPQHQQQLQRRHHHHRQQQQHQQHDVQEQRSSTKRFSAFGRSRHRSNSSTVRATATTVTFCAAVAEHKKSASTPACSGGTASSPQSAAAAGDGTPIIFPGLLPGSTLVSAAELPGSGRVARAKPEQVHHGQGVGGGGAVRAGGLASPTTTTTGVGSMKASRSANGRLDACCAGNGGSTGSPVLEATPPTRARSCSPTHQLLSVGELTASSPVFSPSATAAVAESAKTRLSLQVSDV